MKKPNRRSKRSSVSDFTPPAALADDEGDEQHQQQCYNKGVDDLEKENEDLKMEIEELKQKAANLSPSSVDGLRKLKEDDDSQKLRFLEDQVTDLKKKFNGLSQLSARKHYSSQKQQSGDAGSPQDQIQRLKVQKVQLFCKMKLDSVQFRLSKASLEKEILQLKKEARRKDYEMRKLLALNEKQRLVLQQKTKEASTATKRLKELLESRKGSDSKGGKSPGVQGIEIELKVAARVEEIRADYERVMEEMADELRKFEEEAETLRQENFRCLLQDKEVECTVRDSELRDLKEEIVRLSNLVNQPGVLKAEINRKKLEANLVKPSASYAISDFMDTSEPDYSGGNTAAPVKSTPQMCCSCSKKSLCKTLKCECRAAGGSCGAGCGCTTSKCSNRSILFIKVDDSPERKEAQDSVDSSGNSGSQEVIVSEPPDLDNECVPVPRKPLHEIGNALANSSPIAKKPGKKMGGRKPVNIAETFSSVSGLKKVDADAHQMRQTRARRPQASK
ncbi:kinesin-like protein KIN-4C isoform X2 [Euphorbia lathyris]|uniref:kinesin-like protein KIN-4C isoform X2 n=1 Tax=Euphorbia lathyris TaxID=212925 RepID=UPI003313593B